MTTFLNIARNDKFQYLTIRGKPNVTVSSNAFDDTTIFNVYYIAQIPMYMHRCLTWNSGIINGLFEVMIDGIPDNAIQTRLLLNPAFLKSFPEFTIQDAKVENDPEWSFDLSTLTFPESVWRRLYFIYTFCLISDLDEKGNAAIYNLIELVKRNQVLLVESVEKLQNM